jgi:hypothetical protein
MTRCMRCQASAWLVCTGFSHDSGRLAALKKLKEEQKESRRRTVYRIAAPQIRQSIVSGKRFRNFDW